MKAINVRRLRDKKTEWLDIIIGRLNETPPKLLPFISNSISNDLVFGSHERLIEGWANYTEYPRSDKHNLPQITQYHSVILKADPDVKADDLAIKEDYLAFLHHAIVSEADEDLVAELEEDVNRNRLTFSETAERLHLPNFDDSNPNVLALLADLELPIYVTTSYHTFLETALMKANKRPRSEVCRCYGNKGIPSVFETNKQYEPSQDEPLVYHLFGIDQYPDSLVLTEDDHLDLLMNLAKDPDGLPSPLRYALTSSSLVLLGYTLQSWEFRVLFRGLIRATVDKLRPKSVCIQLEGDKLEQDFLKNYLNQEGQFEVYEGDALSFVQKLREGRIRR